MTDDSRLDAALDRCDAALELCEAATALSDWALTQAASWTEIAEALAESLRVCTVAGPRPDFARLSNARKAALDRFDAAVVKAQEGMPDEGAAALAAADRAAEVATRPRIR